MSNETDNPTDGPVSAQAAKQDMRKLANYRMPFGKYKGVRLMCLPEAYFIWFANKGYPKGELGRMMQIAYEMKLNGLDHLLDPLVTNRSSEKR